MTYKINATGQTVIIDEDKFRFLILKYIDEILQQVAEAMNREMAIQLNGFGGINVPQSWVDEFLANSKFEVINEDGVFSVDLISRNFTNWYEESEEATRARVILFGTGKIITKPGEMTWQGGSTSQSRPGSLAMSKAESEYRIPQFEHTSSGFMNPVSSLIGMRDFLIDKAYNDLSDYVTSDEFINSVLYIE